jgi:Protein of unknown function (DUF3565)
MKAQQQHEGKPRKIVGFHLDENLEWVAELECGHNQHVRHNPPWTNRHWVTTLEGRQQHLGTELPCLACVLDSSRQSDERHRRLFFRSTLKSAPMEMKHMTTVLTITDGSILQVGFVCVSCSACIGSFYWAKETTLPRFCPFCSAANVSDQSLNSIR